MVSPSVSNRDRMYITILEFFNEVKLEPPLKMEEVKEALKAYISQFGFKIDNSNHITRTIYLYLPEVKEKDPTLYRLILKDKPLSLRAFHKALKELGVDIRGFSIGFRGCPL